MTLKEQMDKIYRVRNVEIAGEKGPCVLSCLFDSLEAV
jgi:hypothetical protein